jgi:hypothetical protein
MAPAWGERQLTLAISAETARGGAVSCADAASVASYFCAEGIYMRFKDYFYSESKAYEHLSPEKRKLRVTALCVGIGFTALSTIVVVLAFLIRAIYENPHLFRGVQE